MKRQVDVTLTISLWLGATMSEDDVVTHVRSSLPAAFGDALTSLRNPVDVIDIREVQSIDETKGERP